MLGSTHNVVSASKAFASLGSIAAPFTMCLIAEDRRRALQEESTLKKTL
jgi:hypothetical protein